MDSFSIATRCISPLTPSCDMTLSRHTLIHLSLVTLDESKQLKHRLPECPETFWPEINCKIKRYTTTRWQITATDKQATPMLYIPKKNGTLRTMFDLRHQNNNTRKGVTPFPKQDAIQHDIVHAQFRSKLDMTEAYEHTCINPKDMCKTTFSTIFSTFQSELYRWETVMHHLHSSS